MRADPVAVAAPTLRRPTALGRVAGAGGLVFVALLVVQNLVRASGPAFASSPAQVTSYFVTHRAAALVPLALFPLGMVAIVCFTAGICGRPRHDPNAQFWAFVGGLAVAVLAGLFALVNIIEIAIAVGGASLAQSPQAVTALWAVHSAAFGLNLAAIAVALVGLSRVARATGLIPRIIGLLAWPGAACLFTGAVCTVALAEGSPVLFLALVGFVVWGVFLVAAGGRLAFGRSDSVPVDAAGT